MAPASFAPPPVAPGGAPPSASDNEGGHLYFIEVDPTTRRAADSPTHFDDLLALLKQTGFDLDEIWAGESKLYLRVKAEPLDRALRAATVDELSAHPLVARVLGHTAAPFAIHDGHLVQRCPAREPSPEARLRGYREKRRDFRPNLAAAHTGEMTDGHRHHRGV